MKDEQKKTHNRVNELSDKEKLAFKIINLYWIKRFKGVMKLNVGKINELIAFSCNCNCNCILGNLSYYLLQIHWNWFIKCL